MCVSAIVSAGATLIAADKQAKAADKASQRQQESYDSAQALLEKAKKESVTDIDLAEAKASGLIDEGTEAAIKGLQEAGQSYTELLTNTLSKYEDESSRMEREFVEDITASGLIQRADIESGALRAIEELTTASKGGKKAWRSLQYESGLLSPSEQEEYVAEFGEPSEQMTGEEKTANKWMQRSLRGMGLSESGYGVEETARLGTDLRRRKIEDIKFQVDQGNRASSQIANIYQQQGRDLAGQGQSQLSNLLDTKSTFGANRLNTGLDINKDIATTNLGVKEKSGQIREQGALNQANLAFEATQARKNARIGIAGQKGNLLARQGDALYDAKMRQSELERQRDDVLPSYLKGQEKRMAEMASKLAKKGGA